MFLRFIVPKIGLVLRFLKTAKNGMSHTINKLFVNRRCIQFTLIFPVTIEEMAKESGLFLRT